MMGMNDIICTMQENVEHIAGNLNRVMFAMDSLERLDGKISNYMGQRFGTLEFAKGNLDKLAMYLVEDLNEELSKALADIEADECGYVALDNKSIRALDEQLLIMIERIRAAQTEKLSGAATPESGETH